MTFSELLHVLPLALPALVVLLLAPPGASARGIDVVGPGEDPDDAPDRPGGAGRRARPGGAGSVGTDDLLSHQLMREGRWTRGVDAAG